MDNRRVVLAREPVARELLSPHKPEVEDSPPFLPSHLLSALLGTPLTGPFFYVRLRSHGSRESNLRLSHVKMLTKPCPLENIVPPWVRLVRMAGAPRAQRQA